MSWLSRLIQTRTRANAGTKSASEQTLEGLRRLDRKLTVFGASKHQYITHRVSESALAELELWCGVPLPDAFRRHLADTGHGAGPYYGIWDPGAIREELDSLCVDYREDVGASVSPASPFPLSRLDAEKIRQRQAAGEEKPWIVSNWPSDGCIPICHQGCTFWTVLIVTGECAGCVWDVANYEGWEGLWLPGRRPTGSLLNRDEIKPLPPLPSPPAFEDWFQGWIERATTDLGG